MNAEKFLASHPDFSPVDFTVGGIESENGMLSLSPDIHDTDGFFVAKFIKN
jgi:16S rRNA C967 or C1407 C5-methylase (RsmB/RsmF family)